MAANLLAFVHFFIVAPIVVGVLSLHLPNSAVLSRRKRTSRRNNQLQTTFLCHGRRTVLCP